MPSSDRRKINVAGATVVSINNKFHTVFNYNIVSHVLRSNVSISVYCNISTNTTGVASFVTHRRNHGRAFCAGCTFHGRCTDTRDFFGGRGFTGLSCVCNALDGRSNRGPLSFTTFRTGRAKFAIITYGTRSNSAGCFSGSHIHFSSFSVVGTSSTIPITYRPCIISNIPCFSNNVTSPIPIRGTLRSNCSHIVLVLSHLHSRIHGRRGSLTPTHVLRHSRPTTTRGLHVHCGACGSRLRLTGRCRTRNGILVLTPRSLCNLGALGGGFRNLRVVCHGKCTTTRTVPTFLRT